MLLDPFSTIRSKVFVLISLILFAIIALFTIYSFLNIQKNIFNYLDKSNTTINKLLVDNIRGYIYNKEIEPIEQFVNSIHNPYIKNISILGANKEILVQKNKDDFVHSYVSTLGAKDGIKTTKNYVQMTPFLLFEVPLGYLIVEGNLEQYEREVREETISFIWIVIVSLILLFLLSYFLARGISRPIEDIVEKLHNTKHDELLSFKEQKQEEFSYLTQTIQSTHNKLQKLNLNLEKEVHEKTKELHKLNTSLEYKVAEAISDVEEKEKALRQQSRLAQMGEMISMIAHQWRQPLTAISSTAASIELKLMLGQDTKEELTESIKDISGYSQHLSSTINDFRDFFRENKEKRVTNYKDIIESTLSIIGISIQNKNISIEKDDVENIEFISHPNEIKQVVLNLLKNAEDILIEKKIENPTIFIRTYLEGSHNVLEIKDNGGGIPTDIFDKIFDPYFSTKDEKNGTGLGLYMSKTIIEEHCKGELLVENYEKGALFKIVLKIDGENN